MEDPTIFVNEIVGTTSFLLADDTGRRLEIAGPASVWTRLSYQFSFNSRNEVDEYSRKED